MFATWCFSAQEQISEREAQEVTQQSPLTQDISHQYTRFASAISDNGRSQLLVIILFQFID